MKYLGFAILVIVIFATAFIIYIKMGVAPKSLFM